MRAQDNFDTDDLLILLVAISITLNIILGVWFMNSQSERGIVKHTDAYFHPDTGDFTWPNKKED